jgi:sugar transferase (PEP-CTERM system associated)
MIRLFQVYYPVRTLVLLGGEVLLAIASFVLAAIIRLGLDDCILVLNYENGIYKILAIAGTSILAFYYFDLYSPQKLTSKWETYFRLFLVLGMLSLGIAALGYWDPAFMFGGNIFALGILILTFSLLSWRALYMVLLRQPMLREQIYVLGSGERAQRFVEAIRSRSDLGMDVVGWAGANAGVLNREDLGDQIKSLCDREHIHRIIVALQDRRNTMPVSALLDLRLQGVKIEDASTLLEKISGRIDTEALQPSAIVFSDGFKINEGILVARRLVSITASLLVLLIFVPILPIIALLIKATSKGPVFFKQQRVGRRGEPFTLFKLRTMGVDAEAGTGARWAAENDPRVTKFGSFLRKTRLDEIPQLWNVLKGDMGFVGPRPERPEFVQWLEGAIPYYNLRHIIRPGLTGWAQVKYAYGASVEDTKIKLQYDLYYIKHISVALDLMIAFETIKTVLLRRGGR